MDLLRNGPESLELDVEGFLQSTRSVGDSMGRNSATGESKISTSPQPFGAHIKFLLRGIFEMIFFSIWRGNGDWIPRRS